jgi:hypothetical protein
MEARVNFTFRPPYLWERTLYPLNKRLGWVGETAVLYVLGKINISWYYEDSNPAAPKP